jgi:hypothetical protein
MNADKNEKWKNGKKLSGIENLQDMQELLQKTEVPDIRKMGIDETIRHRLEEVDASELGSLEKELGIPPDTEFYRMINSDVEEVYTQPIPTVEKQEPADYEEIPEEEKAAVDSSCSVHVNEDSMSAVIDLNPSKGNGKPLTWETVSKELKANGVVYGVNTELLKKLIQNVEKNKNAKRGVIIAQGEYPEQGRDGEIEFHFSDDESVLFDENTNKEEDTVI